MPVLDNLETTEGDEAVRDEGGLPEEVTIDIDTRPVWEKLQDKIEELTKKVARHFEDQNEREGCQPPMIRAPRQPTAEEWEKHQVTHTPYESWCPHCNAARVVRRDHARIKERAYIVKDTEDNDAGPARVSMDYMYLYERSGKHNHFWNPWSQ